MEQENPNPGWDLQCKYIIDWNFFFYLYLVSVLFLGAD